MDTRLEFHVVSKEHGLTCSLCGGVIPYGHRYWWKKLTHRAEHTNCELYTRGYFITHPGEHQHEKTA